MGRKQGKEGKSYTLPPSPSHSSSSSDFEFSISISPPKSSSTVADELFYKGQLLPLHLSPRISMARTLLLLSSSAPRDSTASTSSSNDSSNYSFASDLAPFPDCDSSRPSTATHDLDDDDYFNNTFNVNKPTPTNNNNNNNTKYFSFSKLSSVFRKGNHNPKSGHPEIVSVSTSSVKRMSNNAKEIIRKYVKKVKPFYEKFSHKQQHRTVSSLLTKTERSAKETEVSDSGKGSVRRETEGVISQSFSGNLRYPLRRRSAVSSCPSSMRSSPSHSGVLSKGGFDGAVGRVAGGTCYGDASTMEELQSAIQGAIVHCKNSLIQNKTIYASH